MPKANCQMTPLKAQEVNPVAYALTVLLPFKHLEVRLITLLKAHNLNTNS